MMLDTEDVLEIARHTSVHLGELGFLRDGSESWEERSGFLDRSSAAVIRWLGASPRSPAADLEAAARTRRDSLWSAHIRKLNEELLDRAGPTFTRVIAEALLERATVLDPRVLEIAEQVARARRISPPAAAPEKKPGKLPLHAR